jgi:hypothetical protein
MATRNDLNLSYRFYSKKINTIILLVLIGVFLFLSLAFYAYVIEPNNQSFLQFFVFIFGVLYLAGLMVAKELLFTYKTYAYYYRMIEEKVPPFPVKTLPFSESFRDRIIKEGFLSGVDRDLYTIFYKCFPSLPYVRRTGFSVVWIISLKGDIDFYDSKIEDDLSYIRTKINDSSKLQNEISLIFKKVDSWNLSIQEAFQQIINFSVQNRAMISIPCAFITKKNEVYALMPTKQFPNKYYYAAIQFLKEVTVKSHDQ